MLRRHSQLQLILADLRHSCSRLMQCFASSHASGQGRGCCQPSADARLVAAQVHLLVRGEKMRASGAMQDRVQAHEKVTVHYQTKVEDAYGDGKGLAGLRLLEGPDGGALVMCELATCRSDHRRAHIRSA